MPSPPLRQGAGKGFKSFEPLRQFNFNQQRSSRRFSPQSPHAQYDGQDYSYGQQRRGRQQDYYNDYLPNRRNNAYGEWPRQSQRFPRQMQNYNDNRFYSSRRKTRISSCFLLFLFEKVNNQQEDSVIINVVIQQARSQIINNNNNNNSKHEITDNNVNVATEITTVRL